MTPRQTESPDEIMLRCLQRIAETLEAIRWMLIVMCLLLLGVIGANFADKL